MLRLAWLWVRRRIAAGVVDAGYDDLSLAHIGVFRSGTIEGRRPIELAEDMQVTKQSVNELLGHLERCGYLVREPDPSDSRARVIRLTARGRQLERTVAANAKAAEDEIAELLGRRRFGELRDALRDLLELVGRPQESQPHD